MLARHSAPGDGISPWQILFASRGMKFCLMKVDFLGLSHGSFAAQSSRYSTCKKLSFILLLH